jgi:hypothetical protein
MRSIVKEGETADECEQDDERSADENRSVSEDTAQPVIPVAQLHSGWEQKTAGRP